MYLKTTIHFLLLLFVCGSVSAQSKLMDKQAEIIKQYFSDRLEHYNQEQFIVPAHFQMKIKPTDVAAAQAKIWSVWKAINLQKEQLPARSKVIERADHPIHHWELYKEDPMPFYFIEKGNAVNLKKPLFIHLHGSGPKEREFKASLKWSSFYKDGPSLYFIPQIPNKKRYRWWLQPMQLTWERLFRLSMLDEDIDANRLYMLGISEGGYGSQRLGAFYADYLAGAGPMAGGEPLENAPVLNYRHVAFSFQTGENDATFGRNKLTMLAKTTFDSLAKVYPGDFIHKIALQEGKGHGIDYTMTTPYLSAYTRRVNPEAYSWVWFPMDGRYRKGFYNIAIEESPFTVGEKDDLDRVMFDVRMDRSDNTVYVDATLSNPALTKQEPVMKGAIAIYLNQDLVDLTKKVEVIYNGKRVFKGKVALTNANLAESCAMFGDPNRLFPAKVRIGKN